MSLQPGHTFFKTNLLDLWIRNQLEIIFLSAILPLQLQHKLCSVGKKHLSDGLYRFCMNLKNLRQIYGPSRRKCPTLFMQTCGSTHRAEFLLVYPWSTDHAHPVQYKELELESIWGQIKESSFGPEVWILFNPFPHQCPSVQSIQVFCPHSPRAVLQLFLCCEKRQMRDQSHKSHNAPVPYHTLHHSKQKCA